MSAAYYGVGVEGPAPCYPFRQSCQAALSEVDWPSEVKGVVATAWTIEEIKRYVGSIGDMKPFVLISLDRSYSASNWWKILNRDAKEVARVHGLALYKIH